LTHRNAQAARRHGVHAALGLLTLICLSADGHEDIASAREDPHGRAGDLCEFRPPIGAFEPVVEWSWEGSDVLPDHLNVMMTPSVIDLDGDGIPDVVFASTNSRTGGFVEVGVLRALRGRDGAELFTVDDPDHRVNTACSVAVADLDGDGGPPEIIACRATPDGPDPDSYAESRHLMAFEHSGRLRWVSDRLEDVNGPAEDAGGLDWGAPALAHLDTDGDGALELAIVAGRQVLDAHGRLLWTGSCDRGENGSHGPLSLVADLDLDGSPEVVAGSTAYRGDGSILWTAGCNPPVDDGVDAVANFDDDPNPEIVQVRRGHVLLLDSDGTVIWGPVAIPEGGRGGPPTVADFDNDGAPEIGVAAAYRYVVIETDGSIKWEAVTQDASSTRTGSSVFDFECDGSAEVVYRDEVMLRVYRGTDGLVLYETPMSSCTWHEYPLVADVDADGNAEIIVVANDNCAIPEQLIELRGIFVLGDARDNWVTTRRIWNQHTYHITNVNDDGTIPSIEEDSWRFPADEPFNNYRAQAVPSATCFAAPDVTASLLRWDPTLCPEGVGVTARIGNEGDNVAGSPVDVAFYDGSTLLGVAQTTRDLGPGESEDVTLIVAPPWSGVRNLCAVADDDGSGAPGAINECNEDNNRTCADLGGRLACTAPPPLLLECSRPGGVSRHDRAARDWLDGATASGTCVVGLEDDAPPLLPSGCPPGATTTVTFTATDAGGGTARCSSSIVVQDATPPDVSLDVGACCLWPPDHRFLDAATVRVTDVCDPDAAAIGLTVTSDEHPSLEPGAGGHAHCPDAVLGDGVVALRAERAGPKGRDNGRVYGAMAAVASDSCDNLASGTASAGGCAECPGVVCVPHDQNPRSPGRRTGNDPAGPCMAVDDGQVFEASAPACPR